MPDPNTLLARDVYDRLYTLIQKGQQDASKALTVPDNDFDSVRIHNAVLIDGARGTGKSTVLVNLPAYLTQKAKSSFESRRPFESERYSVSHHTDLLARVHILKPVDPTLLEEHDDLFLHVVVAAVLSDREVQKAQRDEPGYRAMLRALEDLAHGMESVDAHREERGLDKLRSFIGHRQLNSKVHAFFRSVLMLLGKDLLVLTIDDVDTALDRAYENLEVVRRYLNTPLVLPIISGDLELYSEVIWREFHGKIVKPTPKYKEEQANKLAIKLAAEYQRKILPMPNRLRMPSISEYLGDFEIELRNLGSNQEEGTVVPLGAFHAWLEGFIAGPVNEQENSKLTLPIPSIRSLAQLIRRCGQDNLLEMLPKGLRYAENVLAAKRVGQLAPSISNELIGQFEIEYANAELVKDRDFRPVYKNFASAVRAAQGPRSENADKERNISGRDDIRVRLSQRLHEQFANEAEAGPICLVLEAMQHWYRDNNSSSSILATALFQPLRHSDAAYDVFEKQDSLSSWGDALAKQLPGYWLKEIGSRRVLLPYPLPENGRWGRLGWDFAQLNKKPPERLLLRLLTHNNYYSESGRGTKVNIGRLFEILIASLVHDVSAQYLVNLLHRAPFHSTSTLAPTKTQNSAFNEIDEDLGGAETDSDQLPVDAIAELVKDIQEWREAHQLDQVRFSPWLIYNVFNKVFNQAQIFNRSQRIDRPADYAETSFQIGLHGFYSVWSACGSFEKGRLFGLPARISTVNLRTTNAFEKNPLFRQNILPFFPQGGEKESDVAQYGKSMRAATYYLGDHPLRKWLEKAITNNSSISESDVAVPSVATEKLSLEEGANLHLRKLLGVQVKSSGLINKTLLASLRNLSEESAKKIIDEMHEHYPETAAVRRLEKAYDEIQGNPPQES